MIRIVTAQGKRGREREYRIPSGWGELDKTTIRPAAKLLPYLKEGAYHDEALRGICGIPKKTWKKLTSAEKLYISYELRWIAETRPELDDNLVGSVRLQGKRYEGFARLFSDMTWGEFIWADTFFMLGRPAELAAVLWREKTRGERERTPFDEEGMRRRTAMFRRLPPETTAAIFLNYAATRKKALEDRYTNVFPQPAGRKTGKEEGEEETKALDGKGKGSPAWFETHYALVGENITEEGGYLKARLSTAMQLLDRRIRTERETRRRKR